VERLHVELLLALQLDKPHRRTRRRFGDPFSVAKERRSWNGPPLLSAL
jgi:hypothetical protein